MAVYPKVGVQDVAVRRFALKDRADVKVRYLRETPKAISSSNAKNGIDITMDNPQERVAPGQQSSETACESYQELDRRYSPVLPEKVKKLKPVNILDRNLFAVNKGSYLRETPKAISSSNAKNGIDITMDNPQERVAPGQQSSETLCYQVSQPGQPMIKSDLRKNTQLTRKKEQERAQHEMAKLIGHVKAFDMLGTPQAPASSAELTMQEMKRTISRGCYGSFLRDYQNATRKGDGIVQPPQKRKDQLKLEDDNGFTSIRNANLTGNDLVNNNQVNAVVSSSTGLSLNNLADGFALVSQYDIPVANVILHANQTRDIRVWTNRQFDPVNKVAAVGSDANVNNGAISENPSLRRFRGKSRLPAATRRDCTHRISNGDDDTVRTAWQHAEAGRNAQPLSATKGNNVRTQRELLKTGYIGDIWG